jgi:hypothetical protein
MRPFDRTDWYGWAGAESFGENDPPYIAYAKVVNWPEIDEYNFENENPIDEVAVIVDKNGASINGSNGAYQIDMGSKETNLSEANQMLLHQPIDVNQLKEQGWEETNIFPLEEQRKRRQENMLRDQQRKNQPDPAKQRELESGRKPMEASAKKAAMSGSTTIPTELLDQILNFLGNASAPSSDYDQEFQQERESITKRLELVKSGQDYRTLEASAKTAGPMDEGVDPNLISDINEQTRQDEDQMYRELEQEGQEDRELHEGWPDSDVETTESMISHAANVLQDSSMEQEARLQRVWDEIGAFLGK